MAYTPIAPEFGCKYTLTGPNGAVATFNDTTDPNDVGVITEITGLDSPEVVESFTPFVEGDGAKHNPFYLGRRPVVIAGLVYGHASAAARHAKLDRLIRASNALRADSTLTWTPSGGVPVQLLVRRNQPLRVTKGWNKEFQLGLVSAWPYIESVTVNTSETTASVTLPHTMTVENKGSGEAFPTMLRIWGPITNPQVTNTTTGITIWGLTGTIAAGEYYTVVVRKPPTVLRNDGTNKYGDTNFLVSNWNGLVTGNNVLTLTGSTPGATTKFRVEWRDAWV